MFKLNLCLNLCLLSTWWKMGLLTFLVNKSWKWDFSLTDYCTWANCTIYCAALMWIEVSVWPFDERKLSWSYIMFLWTCLSILEERSRRKVLSLWWCEGYFWADLSWCDVMVGTWMYLSWIFIQWSLLSPGICIILVHLLIKFKLHFLPESVAVVSLGKFCLRNMLLCIA